MSVGYSAEQVAEGLTLRDEDVRRFAPLFESVGRRDREVLDRWARETVARANLLRAAAEGHAELAVVGGEVLFSAPRS